MRYCPKCGVKVNGKVEKCPVCNFEISKLNIENDKSINKFKERAKVSSRIKKRVFALVTAILFSNISLLIYNNIYIDGKLTYAKYSTVSIFASWVYLFFLFGFIPSFKKSVIGISINTLIFLFFLDIFNGKLDWFQFIGIPAVVIALIITLFIYYISKKVQKRGTNIAAYIIFGIVVYCMGLELFLNMYLRHRLYLEWSIELSIQIVPIAIVLLFLHYGLPIKYKERLKKKFNI